MELIVNAYAKIVSHRPLYERGLHEIANVTVSAIHLTTSSEQPPLDPEDLSPVRITWIIFGTLVLFVLGVLLVSGVKKVKHFYCCSKTCLEDTLRSAYNCVADGCMMCLRSVGLVSSDLRLYYGSGFDLTTQEEEADFYGETRTNLPSDNLDIHYGGDHRNLRSTYLEDDDDTSNSNGSSAQRLPPKHGKIRAGIGKIFGKLRGSRPDPNGYNPTPNSPAASRHMSPVSSMIEMSERNGREVVSPLTVPTQFVNSPHSAQPYGYAHTNQNRSYGEYDPNNDDSIDDIGDFTHLPLKASASRYNHTPEDEYESFVV